MTTSGECLLVRKLARAFADFRVIPFVGAGASIGHVRVDWDALSGEMARLANATGTNPEVVSAYVAKFGRAALRDLLKGRLHVDAFDPCKGEVQMLMLGLNAQSIYTTNQDELIELCYAHYGRPLHRVIDVDDIAKVRPGDSILYKYHGDLSREESIVFCQEDFERRGPHSSHPLDIRLRSDVLAKSLAFIGYSFRDPNVQALFAHLKSLFGGQLPPSYLIEYHHDAGFADDLHRQFGVQAIDCRAEYPDETDDGAAFRRLLRDLSLETRRAATDRSLEDFFKPKTPTPIHVVTQLDVDEVARLVKEEPEEAGLNAFRGTYDGSAIPVEFQVQVADQFLELCKGASTDRHAGELRGALFNLRLDGEAALTALAACCAVANVLPPARGGFQSFLPHIKALPDDMNLLAIGLAIILLAEWGRPLSPAFYEWIAFASYRFPAEEDVPVEVWTAVAQVFGNAYAPGRTTYENPLSRARRLRGSPGIMRPPGHRAHLEKLVAMLPKRFARPYRSE